MPVRAEFVGGPKDGETTVLHAAMWQLRVASDPAAMLLEEDGEIELRKVQTEHVYKLRPGTPLGLSTGYVFYDYDGRRR